MNMCVCVRKIEGWVRVGELSKIPYKGVEKKKGEWKFYKGGQAGLRGGCYKKRGLELPYEL